MNPNKLSLLGLFRNKLGRAPKLDIKLRFEPVPNFSGTINANSEFSDL
jgi:hypothetical protein